MWLHRHSSIKLTQKVAHICRWCTINTALTEVKGITSSVPLSLLLICFQSCTLYKSTQWKNKSIYGTVTSAGKQNPLTSAVSLLPQVPAGSLETVTAGLLSGFSLELNTVWSTAVRLYRKPSQYQAVTAWWQTLSLATSQSCQVRCTLTGLPVCAHLSQAGF